MSVWFFSSSGEAYDATQCDDRIKNGNALVVISEMVVGVAHTWPIAVTTNRGAFHGVSNRLAFVDAGITKEQVEYAISIAWTFTTDTCVESSGYAYE